MHTPEFRVGDLVRTLCELDDLTGNSLPRGTTGMIVGSTPAVGHVLCMINGYTQVFYAEYLERLDGTNTID